MFHALLRSRSKIVIVLHHFRQQVQGIRSRQMLVILVYEG